MARKRRKRQPTAPPPAGDRTIAVNRRARRDYEVLATLTAGLELVGSEVKSIRNGAVSLAQGFVTVEAGEAWLHGAHVARYKPAADANHDPDRPRRLLLHRGEIAQLASHVTAKGRTAVPLRLLLHRGWVKLEIGLVRGLRRFDHRERLRAREAAREIARYVR